MKFKILSWAVGVTPLFPQCVTQEPSFVSGTVYKTNMLGLVLIGTTGSRFLRVSGPLEISFSQTPRSELLMG